MPFDWSILLTAHGSSSHASIPSVIRIMIFLPGSSGKSSAALSNERAIGVVPWALSLESSCLIIRLDPFLIGTTSSVSSQSCWPSTCIVWWPYALKPSSSSAVPYRAARDEERSLVARVIFLSPLQNAFMLLDASNTNRILVGPSELSSELS